MGFVDKIKNILTWESAVTLIVFFGCLTAIGIIGIVFQNEIVYVGVLIAFGIPTSIFGNLAASASTAQVPVTPTISSNCSSDELKKDINDLRVSIANLANETLLLKNCIGELNGNE